MRFLVVVLAVVLGGCGGLEKQRVVEERAALDEWKKAIPLIQSHPGVTDAEKKNWKLFADSQEFRVKQQEEFIK
jgi:hypothetical protein